MHTFLWSWHALSAGESAALASSTGAPAALTGSVARLLRAAGVVGPSGAREVDPVGITLLVTVAQSCACARHRIRIMHARKTCMREHASLRCQSWGI